MFKIKTGLKSTTTRGVVAVLAGMAFLSIPTSAIASLGNSEIQSCSSDAKAIVDAATIPRSATFSSSVNYKGDSGVIPSFRLRVAGKYEQKTDSAPAAFNVNFRLITSGDSFALGGVYVNNKFYLRSGSTYYYLSGNKGAKLASKLSSLAGSSNKPPFGFDPRSLLTNLEVVGPTNGALCHVHGNIDLNKAFDALLANLAEIKAKLPKTPKGRVIGGKVIDRLTARIQKLQSLMQTSPTIDLAVGKRDNVVRQRIVKAEISQAQPDGTTLQGTVVLARNFTLVNRDQVIRDPSSYTTP